MQWMDLYEINAKHNLAETCCASVSLKDLQHFSGQDSSVIDISHKQTYGAIRGSECLRSNIANLYSSSSMPRLAPGNVLVTNGAIQANFLTLYSFVGPGDHVICHYPTYQQLYSVPRSFGAEVSLWKSSEKYDWKLNLEELKSLIQPNTKLIIIKLVLKIGTSTLNSTDFYSQQPSKPNWGHNPTQGNARDCQYCQTESDHHPL